MSAWLVLFLGRQPTHDDGVEVASCASTRRGWQKRVSENVSAVTLPHQRGSLTLQALQKRRFRSVEAGDVRKDEVDIALNLRFRDILLSSLKSRRVHVDA